MNGAPQRVYLPKEEAASPTVLTESMFITLAVAVNEKRHVRCYNVPSALVNTDNTEKQAGRDDGAYCTTDIL